MRPARLDGTWTLSGWDAGKGAIYGRVTITADPAAPDEFTTAITYRVARTGETVTRTGRALVYTGFQWRGRSTTAAGADSALREVMFVDRDWRQIEGRWFTGGYDEVGLDVRLDRVGAETRVLGTDRTALKQGAAGQELKIYGANFPAGLRPADIDLGPGLTVSPHRQRHARSGDGRGRRGGRRRRSARAICSSPAPRRPRRSSCSTASMRSR